MVTFGFLVDDILEVDEEFLSIVIEHKMSMRWVDWRVRLADWAADNVSALTHEQTMIDRSQRYVLQRRPRIRATHNCSNRIFVQNLIGPNRQNGL